MRFDEPPGRHAESAADAAWPYLLVAALARAGTDSVVMRRAHVDARRAASEGRAAAVDGRRGRRGVGRRAAERRRRGARLGDDRGGHDHARTTRGPRLASRRRRATAPRRPRRRGRWPGSPSAGTRSRSGPKASIRSAGSIRVAEPEVRTIRQPASVRVRSLRGRRHPGACRGRCGGGVVASARWRPRSPSPWRCSCPRRSPG